MSKETKKRIIYNEVFLSAIKLKFGYTIDYIRKCLRGDRTGIIPDKIVSEYKTLETAEKRMVEKHLNKD